MANISDIVNSKTNQVTLEGTKTNWIDHAAGALFGSWEITRGTISTELVVRYRIVRDNEDKYGMEVNMLWIPNNSTNSGSAGIWNDVETLVTSVGGPDNSSGWTLYGTQSSVEVVAQFRKSGANTDIFMATVDGGTNWSSGNKVFFTGLIPLNSKPSIFDDNLMTSSGLPVASGGSYGVIDYEEYSFTLGGNGGYISGGAGKAVRVGNMVTITFDAAIHGTGVSADTGVGFLPASFRPTGDSVGTNYNRESGTAGNLCVRVYPDGMIGTNYSDFSGGGQLRGDTAYPASISYVIV